jgi:sec-independent protein translocase protein TatA
MPFGIGIWELLILLLVLLLVFGPKRLPEMGRQLGKGMREFKESVSGSGKDDDDHTVDEIAELPPADTTTTSAAPSRERDTVS